MVCNYVFFLFFTKQKQLFSLLVPDCSIPIWHKKRLAKTKHEQYLRLNSTRYGTFIALICIYFLTHQLKHTLGAGWDGSFGYPQHIFWMRNKESSFPIHTLILRPAWTTPLELKIPMTTSIGCLLFSSLAIFLLKREENYILSSQPRVTVTPFFVYKVIRDLESIDHLCIDPIRRIGLIHKWSIDSRYSSGVYKLMFYLTIVNKVLRHCHSLLARQYHNCKGGKEKYALLITIWQYKACRYEEGLVFPSHPPSNNRLK